MWNDFLQDLAYAGRSLRKNKIFSITVILTLALGIGANTAIFSLTNAVLLKALPVRDPDHLVLLTNPAGGGYGQGAQTGVRRNLSWNEFKLLHEQDKVFSDFFAIQNSNDEVRFTLDRGSSETAHARLVTPNYFSALGVNAIRGRTLLPDDDRPGNPAPVIVISAAFWKKQFGASPGALGQKLHVGRAVLTIVGITQPGFFGETVGSAIDFWIPLQLMPQVYPGYNFLTEKDMTWLTSMGRLKPGITRAQAQAATNVLFQQIIRAEAPLHMSSEEVRHYMDQRLEFKDGRSGVSQLRSEFSNALLVLMIAVGLVLLIACANVANLLLARAMGRQRELSIRLAMGAVGGRLMRQMMTESILFGILGGCAGLLLSLWGTRALLVLVSGDGVAIPLDLDIDLKVFGFTLAASILTGILFGVAPALQSRRVDIAGVLQRTSRSLSEGGTRFHLRKVLVIGQVALSLLLLMGAGLFVRTLQNLTKADLGYRRDHLLVMDVDFAAAGYKDVRLNALYKSLPERLRSIPGVSSVSYSVNGLFSGNDMGDLISVQGFTPGKRRPSAHFDQVGANYFHTVGIPLLAGRNFTQADSEQAPRVMIVNQAFVKEFIKDGKAIGRWVRDEYPGEPRNTFTIIGVAANVKDHSLRDDPRSRFYVPMLNGFVPPSSSVNVEIRTAADPVRIQAAVKKTMMQIDNGITINSLHTVNEQVDRMLNTERAVAKLCSYFGMAALLLASIGIYGVMAYSVSRRTSEMGLRIALGAERGGLVWLVLRETLTLAAIGLAIGIPASLGATHLISSKLFGVAPYDPVTLGSAVLILASMAALAGFLPAMRAARVDPVQAMRYE